MRNVVPVPRGGHLPLRAARLFLLCVLLEIFATPTGRYHRRMLIHPSRPACATRRVSDCTHAGSGPSRVCRRLLRTCLGDPIPLAIIFSAILSHSPCGLSALIEYQFFSDQDQEMTTVLFQISLHIEKRVEHLTRILFHCLLIHRRCR